MQACDVSLLINGGFSPLTGFMKKADYDSVAAPLEWLWDLRITMAWNLGSG